LDLLSYRRPRKGPAVKVKFGPALGDPLGSGFGVEHVDFQILARRGSSEPWVDVGTLTAHARMKGTRYVTGSYEASLEVGDLFEGATFERAPWAPGTRTQRQRSAAAKQAAKEWVVETLEAVGWGL